jgi:hypothetical protein
MVTAWIREVFMFVPIVTMLYFHHQSFKTQNRQSAKLEEDPTPISAEGYDCNSSSDEDINRSPRSDLGYERSHHKSNLET